MVGADDFTVLDAGRFMVISGHFVPVILFLSFCSVSVAHEVGRFL
jgi:hypothetical protein